MWHRAFSYSLFLALVISLGFAGPSRAAETPRKTPAPAADDPAEQEWTKLKQQIDAANQVRYSSQDKKSSEAGLADFLKQARPVFRATAEACVAYAQRFPLSERAREARFFVVHLFAHAVAAGDPAAEADARRFIETALNNETLPEQARAEVLLASVNIDMTKQVGTKLFTEGLPRDDHDIFFLKSLRQVRERFPTNEFAYMGLLAVAERSEPDLKKQLATELIAAEHAPAVIKASAHHLLNGTKPFQVGKPVDIRFTALDGQKVDLAALKGKVVLVQFWSTTCGPCLTEMPHVKKLYEKYHAQGLEIIGISLDDNEKDLRKYLAKEKIPWPQHFDGQGFGNEFALRYGIFGIPTIWIVDAAGILRNGKARFHGEGDDVQIVRLLKQVDGSKTPQ